MTPKFFVCYCLLAFLKKIEKRNLWRITDEKELQNTIDKLFQEKSELVAKVRSIKIIVGKRNNKHFNKLRNLFIETTQKRIDPSDAEKMVILKLKKT